MPTSPTFTERRLYRLAAVLQAFQSAQGTPVEDFTTISTRPIWAREALFDPGITKEDFQGTHGSPRKRGEARFLKERKPMVKLIGGATPKNIEWLLRSAIGPWTGGGTLTLTFSPGINEFATLGLAEKTPSPNAQQFLRFWDAWAHRVSFRMASGLTTLDVEADFACRDFDRTAMNALPPIVLPASFAPPAIDVFAPHSFRLFRDPAGANVSIAVRELEITFENGVEHETWNDAAAQVIAEGFNKVSVRLRGVWIDETLAIQQDAENKNTVFRRFKAEWTVGAKVFTIDLKNVDFVPSATGWVDGRFREFIVEGEGYLNSSGDYADVTLVP